MSLKAAILSVLGRDDLKHIVSDLRIVDADRRSIDRMRAKSDRSRTVTTDDLLWYLRNDQLKAVCKEEGLPTKGRRDDLVERLVGTTAATDVFQTAGLTADHICEVRQPVALLYDEHSPFDRTRDFLASKLANCKTEMVPGANHLAPVQSPEEFTALVRKHLLAMAGSDATADLIFGSDPFIAFENAHAVRNVSLQKPPSPYVAFVIDQHRRRRSRWDDGRIAGNLGRIHAFDAQFA